MNNKIVLFIILAIVISCNNTRTTGFENNTAINEKKINPNKKYKNKIIIEDNNNKDSNKYNFDDDEAIHIDIKENLNKNFTMTIGNNGKTILPTTIIFEGDEVEYLSTDNKKKYTFKNMIIRGESKLFAEENHNLYNAIDLNDIEINENNIVLKSNINNEYTISIKNSTKLYNKIKNSVGLVKLDFIIYSTKNNKKLPKPFSIYIKVITED